MITGPCSIESEEQIRKSANLLKKLNLTTLRAGCFKPRTSPYSFQGLGVEGLKMLSDIRDEFGFNIISEVKDASHVKDVINYTDTNFVEEVEKIAGKNGVDVVYDGVGIKTFDGSIETLKVRGMMVAFGNASGYVDTIDVKKHINAKGLFFTRPSIAHYTMTREELVDSAKKVFDAILSRKFKVEISKRYSLDDSKKAHEELEARLLTGPAVIIPN